LLNISVDVYIRLTSTTDPASLGVSCCESKSVSSEWSMKSVSSQWSMKSVSSQWSMKSVSSQWSMKSVS